MRIRKLVEALTDLICFRRTNEDAYYQHFLLLRDLNEARGTQEDLKVFYACPSLNVGAQVDRLAGEVGRLESSGSVDLNAAWYLPPVAGPRSPKQLAAIRPGGYLASTRARLRAALPVADAPERLALGVSYDRLFTRVSRDIHFTPSARGREAGVEAVSLGLDECGILGLHLLLAVLRLLGVEGGPQCQRVSRIFAENAYPGELSERVTRGTAKPGDFVLAYGDLGEVIEVAESEFGYVSYKVLYLAEKPLPGIPQDWFPAQTVRVLFSRESLLARVSELVEAGELPDNIARRLTTEGGEAFRASVTELWDRALREYVLGR